VPVLTAPKSTSKKIGHFLGDLPFLRSISFLGNSDRRKFHISKHPSFLLRRRIRWELIYHILVLVVVALHCDVAGHAADWARPRVEGFHEQVRNE